MGNIKIIIITVIMHRTTDTSMRFNTVDNRNISCCQMFHGEDRAIGQRQAMQKLQQKQWLDQQVQEHKEKQEKEADYQQLLYQIELGNQLEKEAKNTKDTITKATSYTNKQFDIIDKENKNFNETQKKFEEREYVDRLL